MHGFKLNQSLNGNISFYIGSILIAEISISAFITDEPVTVGSDQVYGSVADDPYSAIFVSYSHEDTFIVQELERAYTALGLQYIRDVNILRSGQRWNKELLSKINEADIFQLCWSKAAKKSKFVKREYKHALKLKREAFLRPVYWEVPMPDPPKALKDIHFAYLQRS